MRGEDYVRGICVSFQPIYILHIRAPQKSTFYDIIPLDIKKCRYFNDKISHDSRPQSNLNHISILSDCDYALG